MPCLCALLHQIAVRFSFKRGCGLRAFYLGSGLRVASKAATSDPRYFCASPTTEQIKRSTLPNGSPQAFPIGCNPPSVPLLPLRKISAADSVVEAELSLETLERGGWGLASVPGWAAEVRWVVCCRLRTSPDSKEARTESGRQHQRGFVRVGFRSIVGHDRLVDCSSRKAELFQIYSEQLELCTRQNKKLGP